MLKRKKWVKLKLEGKRKRMNNKQKMDYYAKYVRQNLIAEINYLSIFKKQGMQLINEKFFVFAF